MSRDHARRQPLGVGAMGYFAAANSRPLRPARTSRGTERAESRRTRRTHAASRSSRDSRRRRRSEARAPPPRRLGRGARRRPPSICQTRAGGSVTSTASRAWAWTGRPRARVRRPTRRGPRAQTAGGLRERRERLRRPPATRKPPPPPRACPGRICTRGSGPRSRRVAPVPVRGAVAALTGAGRGDAASAAASICARAGGYAGRLGFCSRHGTYPETLYFCCAYVPP